MNRTYELGLVPEADFIIGVDEAGRGALAGPVGVAAVCLDPEFVFEDARVCDSKKLTARARKNAFEEITKQEQIYAVELVPNELVDELNVLHATLRGMRTCVIRCIEQLKEQYELPEDVRICVLVDGNQRIPNLHVGVVQHTVEQGDALCYTIAAASILAKESRDTFVLEQMHTEFPMYNFAQHKAYGTAAHLEAIRTHGICRFHRKSFGPCM
jgi:ribonuclease HII